MRKTESVDQFLKRGGQVKKLDTPKYQKPSKHYRFKDLQRPSGEVDKRRR
jgi:hypothetical protein